MSDKIPARICTVPTFDDSDKAICGGCLLVVLALFVLASLCRTASLKPPTRADAEKPRTVTVCSGCGSKVEGETQGTQVASERARSTAANKGGGEHERDE